ncbi:putative glutaredoxin-C14 [Magnolia sinica]|uniref:putative glutaredoxin-C14 n=1 Tax=Magnolia sinica TaxID=86752 RepID=UPI0026591EB4|nr:putative glutaredoxin-C14 [Magnolia sinica]
MDQVMRLAGQNGLVIFSNSSCCMCHSIKRLFCEFGANAAVYELDQEPRGKEIEEALVRLLGRRSPLPAVFIGGQLVGSTNEVMSLHLRPDGSRSRLITLLKEARVIWLYLYSTALILL